MRLAAYILPLLFSSSVNAFPSRPGACPADMAAVMGNHVSRAAEGVLFSEKGYELVVSEMVLGDSPMEVTDGETYTITVQSTADSMFRGALIRASGNGDFTAGENAQIAEVCADVPGVGVGHMDKELKSSLSGDFTVMGTGSIMLDVTVVESNTEVNGSVWSYQQFELMAVDAGMMDNATVAPTEDPGDSSAHASSLMFSGAMAAFLYFW